MAEDFSIQRIHELPDGSYSNDAYVAIDRSDFAGLKKLPLGRLVGQPGEDGYSPVVAMEEVPATPTSPKGLLIRVTDKEHEYGQTIEIADEIIDVLRENLQHTINYRLGILPNSIGRSKLRNPTIFIPDARYLKMTPFSDSRGNFQVASLCDDLQDFLHSIGYKSEITTVDTSIVSNVLTYTGSLPAFSSTTNVSYYTKVAELDIDPKYDVEFHVWGTSAHATTSPSGNDAYSYGLSAIVRQYYAPDDTDVDLYGVMGTAVRFKVGDTVVNVGTPAYNAVFGASPKVYNPTAAELAAHPTKKVSLYLASGCSANPYQATPPASYTLSIQARMTRAKIDTGLLVSGQ